MSDELFLTGDDLALAEQGVGLMLTQLKARKSRSKFVRERVDACKRVLCRLNTINNYAYPYECSDDMQPDIGSEVIVRVDRRETNRTRRAALRSTKGE